MKAIIQLSVLFILIAMFCSCSSNDKKESVNVPNAIEQAFKQKYPNATEVKWEQKGLNFVADCWKDGKELEVWYDPNANWLMTETEIFWGNLPPTVQTAFNSSDFAHWVKDAIYLLEFPLEPQEFVIEVEQGKMDYQLFYSLNGDLMNKVDVTGKDDTIYPPIH